MRRVIRQRIRRSGEGVDLAADINAEIVINVGRSTVPLRDADSPAPNPPPSASPGDEEPRRPDTSEPGGSHD
jgi:hypothetical protein